MRKTNLLLSCLLLLMACQKEKDTNLQPSNSTTNSINDIRGLPDSKTPVSAHLENLNGSLIIDNTTLKPNTKYNLVITGTDLLEYRLKVTDGFRIINSPLFIGKETGHLSGKSLPNKSSRQVFTIITNSDIPDRLYVNIVPIHHRGKELLREYSQVFLLPQNK